MTEANESEDGSKRQALKDVSNLYEAHISQLADSMCLL